MVQAARNPVDLVESDSREANHEEMRLMAQPIDLYYWPTPNGWKATIFLEEAGLPYNVIPVNIGAGDQFEPEFLKGCQIC